MRFIVILFALLFTTGAAMLFCNWLHWRTLTRHRRRRREDLQATADRQLREDLQYGRDLPHEH